MAENESAQERTEKPTQRRLDQAREEGKVARSQDLSTAAVVLTATALLAGAGGTAIGGLGIRLLRDSAAALAAPPMSAEGAIGLIRATGQAMLLALLPFAVGVVAVVGLVNLIQARGTFSLHPLTPRLSHINPLEGLKRILGVDGLVLLLKATAKVVILGGVTWMVLRGAWPTLVSLGDMGVPDLVTVLRHLTMKLSFTVGLAFLALAAADYGWQVFRTEKSLRMTRYEVVREHRETEGDPLVKSRIQSTARARARQRMLQAVPTADVVVTNPTHVAVALRYDVSTHLAPIVVAMGERKLAERIKLIAARAGVPLVENRPVARALLATATVGQPIPSALYAAVAEILAFVYRQRGRRGAGSDS